MKHKRESSLWFPDISEMEGIHLFHFGLSSCSQRVRLALEEKSLDWHGHIIDLDKMENVTDAYQKIHPKGYVPALVHDGQLITESVNIICYIERILPQPQLLPGPQEEQSMVDEWLRAADDHQWSLKTLTYGLLFKKRGLFSSAEDLSYYLTHQKNAELVTFIRDFSEGFPAGRIQSCVDEAQSFLRKVNQAASDHPYLAGAGFSLADIAVVVIVHRYKLLELDTSEYPALERWYQRIAERESFRRAILAYQAD